MRPVIEERVAALLNADDENDLLARVMLLSLVTAKLGLILYIIDAGTGGAVLPDPLSDILRTLLLIAFAVGLLLFRIAPYEAVHRSGSVAEFRDDLDEREGFWVDVTMLGLFTAFLAGTFVLLGVVSSSSRTSQLSSPFFWGAFALGLVLLAAGYWKTEVVHDANG